jgi:hypothetical protein
MRRGVGGLALAAILSITTLSISACSKPEEAAKAAAPAALSLALTRDTHGVLPAQTAHVEAQPVKAAKGAGPYAADVALTPTWWVGDGEFKIVWYAGLSQTKRFFNMSNTKGDPKDEPDYLRNPEMGVRQVQVSFDGGPLQSVKPDTARAAFKTPAGAKAVTQVQVAFGAPDNPQVLTWK